VAFERTRKELATEVEKYCDLEKSIVEKFKKPIAFNSSSSNFYTEANGDEVKQLHQPFGMVFFFILPILTVQILFRLKMKGPPF
jgi:hypothetical protein